jgi:putative endonuclease
MSHLAIGRCGEDLAARHLEENGWTILDRNYRFGRKEIDLVVARGSVLAFVEVKTRTGSGFGHPLEAITRRKRREIAAVAAAWLERHPRAYHIIRFDAVGVMVRPQHPPLVEHVEDAWRRADPA